MRTALSAKLEDGRVRDGPYGSTAADGAMGAFLLMGPKGTLLKIISSGIDKEFDWEHVSVSAEHRVPNWPEMCWVKDLFWNDDECVVQYHPPKASYKNVHPFCLHLWRPLGATIPMPPLELV
jgi:hypothetical protein